MEKRFFSKLIAVLLILIQTFLIICFLLVLMNSRKPKWEWTDYLAVISPENPGQGEVIRAFAPLPIEDDINKTYLRNYLGRISRSFVNEYDIDTDLHYEILRCDKETFQYSIFNDKGDKWEVWVSVSQNDEPRVAVDKG